MRWLNPELRQNWSIETDHKARYSEWRWVDFRVFSCTVDCFLICAFLFSNFIGWFALLTFDDRLKHAKYVDIWCAVAWKSKKLTDDCQSQSYRVESPTFWRTWQSADRLQHCGILWHCLKLAAGLWSWEIRRGQNLAKWSSASLHWIELFNLSCGFVPK